MGAKQRAQNRGKKAAKSSMKGQPMSQKHLNKSISVPDLKSGSRASALQGWNTFAGSASPSNQNGFSMSEEARNTDKRGFGWSTTPLRHTSIRFVSAGNLKREEDAWNTVSEDDSPQKQSDAEPFPQPLLKDGKIPSSNPEPAPVQEVTLQASNVIATEQTITQGVQSEIKSVHVEESITTEVLPPTPPIPGSESDDEILFVGRQTSKQPSRRPSPAPPPPMKQPEEAKGLKPSTESIASKQQSEQAVQQFANITLGLDSPAETPTKPQRKVGHENDLPYGRKYNDDELMQDYIDNMALDDSEEDQGSEEVNHSTRKPYKKTTTYRLFAGDGLENAKVQTRSAGRSAKSLNIPQQAFDWDSDDLEIFDDASTTDEEIENVGQVLRHREHPSGSQYLVLASGLDVSDAKWILHSKLISKSAVEEIRIYEEIKAMNIEQEEDDDDDDEDDDDSDEEDEEALRDLIGDIESEDDENARILSYTAGMSDEQIARALAKQEELGLGSDELILLDGDAAGLGDDLIADAFNMNDDFVPFSLSKHTSNRGRSKHNKKRDSFPSAEAFADALDQDPYGAFDIMDFDRPSLRPRKKGRKSDYPFDLEALEDEDLREELVNTWTKDREKKAIRKREREEARLQASLDMADGSDPAVIKHRIRQFLVHDVDVLELTPMEAPIRASVHRLAKALKLNSASRGKEGVGLGRYPVLTKTPRTPSYTAETIWQIDALMNTRKFFPKHLSQSYKSNKHGPSMPRNRRGGGGVTSGVRLMDGEVVAASAPELGADNKGRVLLEKMGWVAGTGIGAVGNKGILDPIRHTIKTTKAGLG